MGLIDDSTRWFFMLPSSKEAEVRHIYDIAFGARCLLSKGITYESIVFIIDNYSKAKIDTVFANLELQTPLKIYKSNQIDEILENNSYKNAVVFITGHGSPSGLDSENPIKPYPLYKKFQTAPTFRRVVFFLGQCYAGIFNQMPLSSHLGLKKEEHNSRCNIVAIGATGLYSSISTTMQLKDIKWSANIFLMYIFNWIMNPLDVDGDGNFSVMDSFKYATIRTNEALIDIKKQDNLQTLIQQSSLQSCVERLCKDTITEDEKNDLMLQIEALEKMLKIRYITQEPWILNTQIAMNTNFYTIQK